MMGILISNYDDCGDCEYKSQNCRKYICSKFLNDEKSHKHEIRYGKSENFLIVE